VFAGYVLALREQDIGVAVLLRDMHAYGGMTGTGAPRGDHLQIPGLAGELASLRAILAARLLCRAFDRVTYPARSMQRIEHLSVAFAGDAIGGVGAVDQQLITRTVRRSRFEGSFLQHAEARFVRF